MHISSLNYRQTTYSCCSKYLGGATAAWLGGLCPVHQILVWCLMRKGASTSFCRSDMECNERYYRSLSPDTTTFTGHDVPDRMSNVCGAGDGRGPEMGAWGFCLLIKSRLVGEQPVWNVFDSQLQSKILMYQDIFMAHMRFLDPNGFHFLASKLGDIGQVVLPHLASIFRFSRNQNLLARIILQPRAGVFSICRPWIIAYTAHLRPSFRGAPHSDLKSVHLHNLLWRTDHE